MLHKYEVEFKEVELEKYGTWGPRAVFCINHISEVLSMEPNLDYEFLW